MHVFSDTWITWLGEKDKILLEVVNLGFNRSHQSFNQSIEIISHLSIDSLGGQGLQSDLSSIYVVNCITCHLLLFLRGLFTSSVLLVQRPRAMDVVCTLVSCQQLPIRSWRDTDSTFHRCLDRPCTKRWLRSGSHVLWLTLPATKSRHLYISWVADVSEQANRFCVRALIPSMSSLAASCPHFNKAFFSS